MGVIQRRERIGSGPVAAVVGPGSRSGREFGWWAGLRERAVIDTLLSQASSGRGGALALVGEPGIGKTALLMYAREKAGLARVIAVTGDEATEGLPFAHLAVLEEALREFTATLGEQHQESLKVALREDFSGVPGQTSDRHAVGVALLELLAAAAGAEPLVLLIDGGQWIDASTAGALAFTFRRLVADPIAVVVAIREGEDSPLLNSSASSILIGGLEEWETQGLLGPDFDALVAAQLGQATGGNPLAMLNAAGSLSNEQLRGHERITAPIAVGRDLQEAFAARTTDLVEPVRLLMLIVAAEGPAELTLLSAASGRLGVETEPALEGAVSAGFLVMVGSQIQFRHPLMRSAVYHLASKADRQSAHRALAQGLRRGDDLARRAYHLAAATDEPHEGTAALVESAADLASHRFAYAEAARGYADAAALSPSPEDRFRRTVIAANAYFRAGDTAEALNLVDSALLATSDPRERADLLMTHMDVSIQAGRPYVNLVEIMTAAARDVRDLDPFRAAALLISASLPAMAMGRTDLMENAAREAAELVAGTPFAPTAEVILALARLTAGNESGVGQILAFATREHSNRAGAGDHHASRIGGHGAGLDRSGGGSNIVARTPRVKVSSRFDAGQSFPASDQSGLGELLRGRLVGGPG